MKAEGEGQGTLKIQTCFLRFQYFETGVHPQFYNLHNCVRFSLHGALVSYTQHALPESGQKTAYCYAPVLANLLSTASLCLPASRPFASF